MSAKLISSTPRAEETIAYCARVSSSKQENPSIIGLLKFMIREGHWSPFEMAHMTVEIKTSRALAPQFLRHKSFSFQEFSQRYASPDSSIIYMPRRQDFENRQNSIDDLDEETIDWFLEAQRNISNISFDYYLKAIEKGISKESARFLLPAITETKIYMAGNVRSWIHYLELRTKEHGTQEEHVQIANEIRKIFISQFPIISEALGWIATV